MANERKVSTSLQRHIQAYPSPKYFLLVEAMSKADAISKSEVVNKALREYFDRMPEQERQRIVNVSKNSY
jgi:hypothetical protein